MFYDMCSSVKNNGWMSTVLWLLLLIIVPLFTTESWTLLGTANFGTPNPRTP